jgi:hypothetical protein
MDLLNIMKQNFISCTLIYDLSQQQYVMSVGCKEGETNEHDLSIGIVFEDTDALLEYQNDSMVRLILINVQVCPFHPEVGKKMIAIFTKWDPEEGREVREGLEAADADEWEGVIIMDKKQDPGQARGSSTDENNQLAASHAAEIVKGLGLGILLLIAGILVAHFVFGIPFFP